MVTPVRMQESGEPNRKMENPSSKETDILEELMMEETRNTKTAEKDKEEECDFVSRKLTGLEGGPPSEKNSLTPSVPIPSMT